MRKMKQDWVLGMLCQTFLPCSVRNVAQLMKNEGWTSTMDSHWCARARVCGRVVLWNLSSFCAFSRRFEVIRSLFNEEVINMTANEDGMPNEVWF